MCRGQGKAKATHVLTTTVTIDEMKEESKASNKQANSENQTTQHEHSKSVASAAISSHNKSKQKIETFVLKGITKDDAHKLVAQMANFAKIYANLEGFSVMGASERGGIFMRSVCRIFKDTKYVVNHKFGDIIFKIREYTKRDSTLNNNLFNFTQIVENEGTLERQVVFGSKYISGTSVLHLSSHLDIVDDENDSHEKLCITNLSSTNKIGVLVEMEQNRENRMKMFEILKKSSTKDDNNSNSFIENGFVIIDEGYNSHEFIKVWDEYYVTLFVLSGNDDNTNVLVDERKLYFYDYLYFKENKLHTLHEKDILPKCNKAGNESHSLDPIVNASSNTECRLCSRSINSNNSAGDDNICFECKLCQEFLCKDCCHSLIVNKTTQIH